VLEPAESIKNRWYWFCQCECGKTHKANGTSLTSGRTQSCGCLKVDNGVAGCKVILAKRLTVPPEVAAYSRTIRNYKRNAKTRGHEWNLTREAAVALMTSPCVYCGSKPANTVTTDRMKMPYQGIDRFDNNVGYQTDNVVPCCWICQRMKTDNSPEVFLGQIKRIWLRWTSGSSSALVA
jgi:hypothetical protein